MTSGGEKHGIYRAISWLVGYNGAQHAFRERRGVTGTQNTSHFMIVDDFGDLTDK